VVIDNDDDKAVTTLPVIMMILQLYACRTKYPYNKKAGFTSSARNFLLWSWIIVTESDWWQIWWFIYYWCHKCIQDNAYEHKVSPMGFSFVQVCWSIEWWVGSCLPTTDTVLNKLIFHNHWSVFNNNNNNNNNNNIIIIIIINCNWVITRWQWLFYMYTNMR